MNPVALPAVAVAARRCALALSLAACVLQAAAPARADEGKGEHKAEAGKEGHKGEHKEEHEGKHEGEHKPSALHHVTDQPHWETFPTLPEPFNKIPLPPGITKFMILELIAALGIFLIYVPLARRLASGEPP